MSESKVNPQGQVGHSGLSCKPREKPGAGRDWFLRKQKQKQACSRAATSLRSIRCMHTPSDPLRCGAIRGRSEPVYGV
jgi:hypothetical protein